MKKLLATLRPVAKAIAAAALGAVVPLLTVGFTVGFDWKAILAAAGTSALSALAVYVVPNRPTGPWFRPAAAPAAAITPVPPAPPAAPVK